MGKIFEELLVWLIRVIVVDLLWAAITKLCAWLDTTLPGRWPLIIGGLLGIVVYFSIPIFLGILGL